MSKNCSISIFWVSGDDRKNTVQAGEGIGEVSENDAQSSMVSQQISADISEVYNAVSEISTGTGDVYRSAEELRLLSQS